jgi:hypothetical protein
VCILEGKKMGMEGRREEQETKEFAPNTIMDQGSSIQLQYNTIKGGVGVSFL